MEKANFYKEELTKEELEKIEQASKNIGLYGSIEIVKNGGTIDIKETKRIRIRDGKNYNRG